MKELVFYRCEICGNMVCMIKNSGVVPSCCGAEMSAVEVHTEDGPTEKHVPVIHRDGCRVQIKIGQLPHPMTEGHYIEWITLVTNSGSHSCRVSRREKACAVFYLGECEEPKTVYAFCNLHGLWKKDAGGVKDECS